MGTQPMYGNGPVGFGGFARVLGRFLAVVLAFAVLGCSLGGVIDDHSHDYDAALDLAANEDVVTNILRARDRAPLHFSELSQLRGSVQAGVSLGAALPFGPSN